MVNYCFDLALHLGVGGEELKYFQHLSGSPSAGAASGPRSALQMASSPGDLN